MKGRFYNEGYYLQGTFTGASIDVGSLAAIHFRPGLARLYGDGMFCYFDFYSFISYPVRGVWSLCRSWHHALTY